MNHAQRVTEYNAEQRSLNGALFHVIEVASGRVVGDGNPMSYAFAKYVCDVRDFFKTGAFVLKRCN